MISQEPLAFIYEESPWVPGLLDLFIFGSLFCTELYASPKERKISMKTSANIRTASPTNKSYKDDRSSKRFYENNEITTIFICLCHQLVQYHLKVLPVPWM